MYKKIKNLKKRFKVIICAVLFVIAVLISITTLWVMGYSKQNSKDGKDIISILDKLTIDKPKQATGSKSDTSSSKAVTGKNIKQNTPTASSTLKSPTTTPVISIETINAADYGAKGDGNANDTLALQTAIDDASKRNIALSIPKTEKYYKITDTINLRSNVHIIGYGATIYMPSQDIPRSLLYSSENTYISNVKIEGVSFRSDNDRAGTGYYADSVTSNIQGIYIMGVNNLTITNVRMDNMYNGLKLGASLNGLDNINVNISNFNVINSGTPLLMGQTNGFVMSNSTLDADAGNSHWLHSAYVDWGNDNVVFDNVNFINAPGAGVSIGDSYPEKTDPKNIVIKNSVIENANRGFNVYGATQVDIRNVNIRRCNLAFSLWNAKKINVQDIEISESKTDRANETIAPDMGAVQLEESYEINLSNININANTMGGSLFILKNKIDDVRISNVSTKNMDDIGFFYNTSQTSNFIVENSTFEWTRITNPRLSFRGSGASAVFKNNVFKNNGPQYLAVADNYVNTSIKLEDNSYSGFLSLAYSEDYSTVVHNLNLDTGVYDTDK